MAIWQIEFSLTEAYRSGKYILDDVERMEKVQGRMGPEPIFEARSEMTQESHRGLLSQIIGFKHC